MPAIFYDKNCKICLGIGCVDCRREVKTNEDVARIFLNGDVEFKCGCRDGRETLILCHKHMKQAKADFIGFLKEA